MTALNYWFNKGLTIEEYISQMTFHKDNMEHVLQEFNLPDDQAFFDQLASRNLRVIVITEDWCGDAMMNNPVLIALGKAANLDIRFILRDEHADLMDQYLTNGTARSIPIFIFINDLGEEVAKWGPRAAKVQAFVDQARSELPAKEDEAFKAGQELLIKQLTAAYKEREDFWLEVYGELKATLQPL
ncbi:thioredoxin family protein [Jeotgalibacillus sp. S-D1]|uniref:thioredoxin family protein n=1 Tax=Jeotgalibacillus sp. S-D1 TaxID=2552189 RepID=UPI00105938E1|nr:thioredoxin family protein [Jeotgalibacillus sp. S-D1]TDL30599.1 thioredoxin family protein [Jeotgalibacillus sp. S-D1]